jgi:hypothetical protein
MTRARDRLKGRLQQVLGLDERQAEQITGEVLDLFDQTLEEFVVRRHAELQAQGHKTRSSYAQILRELNDWRFKAPPLSLRQIRRRIYG